MRLPYKALTYIFFGLLWWQAIDYNFYGWAFFGRFDPMSRFVPFISALLTAREIRRSESARKGL